MCWKKMLDKRSFSLSGHRTSVALELEFWAALGEIAQAAGEPLSALITRIDAQRAEGQPLASALRVFALKEKL
jgi:predicted DNA-binding ribbon-helix-helix protein